MANQLKKIGDDLSDWDAEEWIAEFAIGAIVNALIQPLIPSPWYWGVLFFLGSGLLIALGVNFVSKRVKWPGTRDISHLETEWPLASKRDLQDTVIMRKTILIERLISKDNSIPAKTFISCSLVGPCVLWTPNQWNITGQTRWNTHAENKMFIPWVSLTGTTFGGIRVEDGHEFRDCAMFSVGMVVKSTLVFEQSNEHSSMPSSPDTSTASPHTDPPARSGGEEHAS